MKIDRRRPGPLRQCGRLYSSCSRQDSEVPSIGVEKLLHWFQLRHHHRGPYVIDYYDRLSPKGLKAIISPAVARAGNRISRPVEILIVGPQAASFFQGRCHDLVTRTKRAYSTRAVNAKLNVPKILCRRGVYMYISPVPGWRSPVRLFGMRAGEKQQVAASWRRTRSEAAQGRAQDVPRAAPPPSGTRGAQRQCERQGRTGRAKSGGARNGRRGKAWEARKGREWSIDMGRAHALYPRADGTRGEGAGRRGRAG
ncbi:hypothetical protein DFH09DRAFT_1091619 [Mycena vulgaris]|nr:hypothetical protein DFH09DRAFT_1091619 [Mycena vulgaris]